MQAALGDPNLLPSLRVRQVQFGLGLKVIGAPDIVLPAYDASLEIPHVGAS